MIVTTKKSTLLPEDEDSQPPVAKPEVALFRKGGIIELLVTVEPVESESGQYETPPA